MRHHNVGIWVDQHRAILLRLEPDREPEVIKIEMDYQKFYKKINTQLTSLDDVWVFGPTGARQELLRYLITDSVARINCDPSDAFTGHVDVTKQDQPVWQDQQHFTYVIPRIFNIGTGSTGREL